MLKIINKIRFTPSSNRMKKMGDVTNAINQFKINKNTNLNFLLKKRFSWMNKFINLDDNGLEVGAGAGFSKHFIKNNNFKICDIENHEHLDLKGIDAQKTNLPDKSYNFVIASNMLHHVAFPIRFLNEMHRILKPGGKLIIQEAYCSVIFQIITILMRHEGFDFTKNIWSENEAMSNNSDAWSGNIAVPHLIFDDKNSFKNKFGSKFLIEHEKIYECLIFLNSGGVSSKTFYIPLNIFFLNIVSYIDKILVYLFPKIFGMGRQIVLKKI
jgi:SAM-dependent methyltransferase